MAGSQDDRDWSGMRSGAMDEDWNERNNPGYVPGGADKLAEKILSEPMVGGDDDRPGFYRTDEEMRVADLRRHRRGLEPGYGDRDARDGYDASKGQ